VVHPIERLRYVARAGAGAGADAALAQEAARALAGLGGDHAGLVTACRRLLARHPAAGPLWWLATRVLTSAEPAREARRVAAELDEDPTEGVLAGSLPEDATVCVVGWPGTAGPALVRRPDVELLVVDVEDELAWRSGRHEREVGRVEIVPGRGLGPAVLASNLVLLDASATGPGGVASPAGSLAAAAVARFAEVPVWAVGGVGRVLAPSLWDALVARLEGLGAGHAPAWERPAEVVPASLVQRVAGPAGVGTLAEAVAAADCPVAPELLRSPQ
jgi:hypothetical protein